MKKIFTMAIVGILSIGVFLLQFGYERTYHPYTFYQVYLDDEIIGIIESKEELDKYINKQGSLIRDQVIEYQGQLETLDVMDSIIKNKINHASKDSFITLQERYRAFSALVTDGEFNAEDRDAVVEALESFPDDFRSGVNVLNTSISNYEMLVNKLDQYFTNAKNEMMIYLQANQPVLNLTEVETHHVTEYFNQNMSEISFSRQVFMDEYVSENEIYLYATDIYSPLGIIVKKFTTFNPSVVTVENVYASIIDRKPCTIEGYQFRVKKSDVEATIVPITLGVALLEEYALTINENSEDLIIYVTDPLIFGDAVEIMETVFVGTEAFKSYREGTQKVVTDTGTIVRDVYVDEDITVRKINVSVKENIFTDANELSSYLLYGDNKEVSTVKASANDTIPTLAYKHGISVEEFFLSNPTFTSINNMFYNGQEITIARIEPKISVVVEMYEVEDRVSAFDKVEQYDSTMSKGDRYISQRGVNGVERISQNVTSVNGTITRVDPISTATIQESKKQITLVGTRNVPSVGSTGSWGWPTRAGYGISSYYGYRIIFGRREFHSGVDIPGGGTGAPVYATNNGVIITLQNSGSYGRHILIDHNNGFYSLYAHLNSYAKGLGVGSTVARGQQIGTIGSSGRVTGPHLHFEIRAGCAGYGCVVDPWPYLRK